MSEEPIANAEVTAAPEATEPKPMTVEEYTTRLTDSWNRVEELAADFAANLTDIWWQDQPASGAGMDMQTSAAMLAARMANFDPGRNAQEFIHLGTIAFAQRVQQRARDEVEEIGEMYREWKAEPDQQGDGDSP
ncbi:hypothetical protein [Nocardia macrotermitis]|uniref:Uncharacterized protein n=1 Tax=Nocardia macrotermitis TaxID=2585198 RepID=A0A7K0DDE5_9NOCA|nr:hypothetical protein [Nocardia macrotermitis]MQY22904.1 hypothetical protein [Nocardia macrotermitis]